MKKTLGIILIFLSILGLVYAQEDVLKNIEKKLSTAKDISMKMTITTYSYSSKGESLPTKMSMELKTIKDPEILRVDFKEPAILAGQIFLLDGEKKITRMYSPSTKEIIESPYTMTQTSTTGATSIPMVGESGKDFSITIEEVSEKNQKLYKIKGIPQKAELKAQYSSLELYVTKDYMPVRLKMYDVQNRLYMEIVWDEIKINSNLSPNQLRTLPPGKIIRQKTPSTTIPLPFVSPTN